MVNGLGRVGRSFFRERIDYGKFGRYVGMVVIGL